MSAAYKLLEEKKDYKVVIVEEDKQIGGISKTINYKGNRMDLGGHRFFSKNQEVNDFWNKILPIQGAPASDEILINRIKYYKKGPNPEDEDKVSLIRRRVSRKVFRLSDVLKL